MTGTLCIQLNVLNAAYKLQNTLTEMHHLKFGTQIKGNKMICPNCERNLGVETIYNYHRTKQKFSEGIAMSYCGNDKTKLLNEAEILLAGSQVTVYKCPYCNKVWNNSKYNYENKRDEHKWIHVRINKIF